VRVWRGRTGRTWTADANSYGTQCSVESKERFGPVAPRVDRRAGEEPGSRRALENGSSFKEVDESRKECKKCKSFRSIAIRM
jgi:hypothetical protein